ncbi:unnamed protein product [Paramecium octaurelia]|uniref:Uncharacterized protein n=1 Tax=Paramecium octaurelia TaxID=43137 RepID=A0A8S1XW83_PAROT|nr:unnamed protein product [Paramecium octaurelia]
MVFILLIQIQQQVKFIFYNRKSFCDQSYDLDSLLVNNTYIESDEDILWKQRLDESSDRFWNNTANIFSLVNNTLSQFYKQEWEQISNLFLALKFTPRKIFHLQIFHRQQTQMVAFIQLEIVSIYIQQNIFAQSL